MPISLRISGTKMRQAGFSPLVNVGIFPAELNQELDRNFSAAKRIFVLMHREDYIAIVLYDQMVKSFDTNAAGLLTIALTIPKGNRLVGGVSPYALLMEVYRRFQVLYMNPQGDGYTIFKDVEADSDIFKTIVDRYSLESDLGRYVRMNTNGTIGTLAVPESQMEVFFRDTQYPEFANFKEIQIAPGLTSSPVLARLGVPRKVLWKVFLNDAFTGKYIDSDSNTCYVKTKDTDEYEFPEVSVNLGEVLSAPGGILEKDGVKWRADYKAETIFGFQQGRVIMYGIQLVLPDDKSQRDYIQSDKRLDDLRILFGRTDMTREIIDGIAKIPANKYKLDHFTVEDRNSFEQYQVRGFAQLDQSNRIVKICLTLNRNTAHEKYRPPVQDNPRTGTDRHPVSTPVDQNQKRYEELLGKHNALKEDLAKIKSDKNALYAKNRSLKKKIIVTGVCGILVLIGSLFLQYLHLSTLQELKKQNKVLSDRILHLEERHQEDSTTIEKYKELQQTAETESTLQSNKETNNPGSTKTTGTDNPKRSNAGIEDERSMINAVLQAIYDKKDLEFVKKLPGYRCLSDKQKTAIGWLIGPDNTRLNKDNGKFYGDSNYEFHLGKAKDIENLQKTYLKKDELKNRATILDEFYDEVYKILNRS